MSTNHNRIKVADLETNQRNKILKTNQNGELEFSDVSDLQLETYNELDCTEEGKALDARQGKVLKEMMDNDYMKLSGNQTFSGVKTTTNTSYPQNAGLVIRNTFTNSNVKNIILSSNSGTGLFCDNTDGTGVFSQTTSGSAGHFYCNGNGKALYVHSLNSPDRTATIIGNTDNDNLYITNKGAGANVKSISTGTGLVFAGNNGYGNTSTISKDGDIKAKSMELGAGTNQKPSLILPNGTLTSNKQNGAIERDENGQLWETHSGVRSKLITTADGLITLAYKSAYAFQTYSSGKITDNKIQATNPIPIGKIGNKSVLKLNAVNDIYCSIWDDGIQPIQSKIEVFLKIENGLFSEETDGNNAFKEIKMIEYSGSNISGVKNYQNMFITDTQNGEILSSDYSYLIYTLQSEIDGELTNKSKTVFLRDISNTRAYGASEGSFSFIVKNTIEYEDATNLNNQNCTSFLINTNYTFYLENITEY